MKGLRFWEYDLDTIELLYIKAIIASQHGGIGRYILPPHTTKRKTTTNLKTKTTRTARKSNCMEVQQPRS